MAEVKVPKLLHKMSMAAQKAWYKKHGMEMPSATATGRSAAQAKKDIGEINKKKARETAIAAAAASKKNKELMKSSERVRQMAANVKAFGGQRPGGDLTTASGMVNYIRSGGYLKAGRLGEETIDEVERINLIKRAAVANKMGKSKFLSKVNARAAQILQQKKDDTISKSKLNYGMSSVPINVEEAIVKTKDVNKQKLKNYVRSLGTQAVIAGKVPFDQVHSPLRAGRKVLKQEETHKPDASIAMTHTLKMKAMSDKDKRTLGKVAALMAAQKKKVKEEFESIDEVTKKEAEAALGGPVKEKPKMPSGKQPAGYRYVRNLARRAMKKGMNEEVEQVVEQDDSMEKKEMAQTQLHFIKYAAEEILEFIKMGGEIEEWYQNKLSKVQSEVESLHSYIEGEKRRTGMVEEVEQLSEGPSHYQYSGTIHSNVGNAKHGEEKDDGHSYSITIPTRGAHQGDLGSFLSSKKAFSKISRENPHLEPHHVLAIMHGTGDDVEDVEVDHKGKTYKHRLYNTQEPDYLYEEVEQVDEKINLVKAKMGDVVKDFYKSKAPQFKGKSMAKRREMAVAAKLGAEREAGMREEVEQIDEQSPAEIKAKYYHDQFNKVKPVKAYDKEGKLVGRYRSMDHAKQMKPGHTYKVEEGVVTEAEGKVAVTPKEKDLAAHHGDKTRITYGDVIKARLKSAAEKAMKKGN